jgi:hypothetical protein
MMEACGGASDEGGAGMEIQWRRPSSRQRAPGTPYSLGGGGSYCWLAVGRGMEAAGEEVVEGEGQTRSTIAAMSSTSEPPHCGRVRQRAGARGGDWERKQRHISDFFAIIWWTQWVLGVGRRGVGEKS